MREDLAPSVFVSAGASLTKPRARNLVVLLAFVGIGLALGAPLVLAPKTLLAGLRNVSVLVFVTLFASASLSAVAKAWKLQLLQSRLDFRLRFLRTLSITAVTDFAFLVSPLGAAGYGVNLGLLKRSGASWAVAATVVGSDQMLDLMFFAVATPIGLVLAMTPVTQLFPKVSAPLVLGIILLVALLVSTLWACRQRVATVLDTIGRRIPWFVSWRPQWIGLCQNVALRLAQLREGQRRWFIALLLLTTMQWLLRYSVLWFSLFELGYHLPLGFVLATQVMVLHAALWTGLPAGGGAGDLALAASFSHWVPLQAMAIALAMWRFSTLYCPLLFGGAGLAALALRRHFKAPAAELSPT